MTLTEKIEDELVAHQVDQLRLEAGQVREALERLRRLEGEVVALLKEREPTAVSQPAAQRRRLESLLGEIHDRIDRAYHALAVAQERELAQVAQVEDQATRQVVNGLVGAALLSRVLSAEKAVQVVQAVRIPNDRTGATLRERWRRQRDGLVVSLQDGLRSALDRGRHLEEMLRLVRGNRTLHFQDGLLPKSRAGAASLVRTGLAQVTNASREATYRAHEALIKGVQAKAVLDHRTSVLCLTRNGRAWMLADGRAFPGTPESYPGSPPWHWNCRSILIPIFRSLSALQEAVHPRLRGRLAELDEDFPIDGEPAPDLDGEAWFRRRSDEGQRAILGRGRWELWKAGKASFVDLLDTTGRPLTLAELQGKLGLEKEEEI